MVAQGCRQLTAFLCIKEGARRGSLLGSLLVAAASASFSYRLQNFETDMQLLQQDAALKIAAQKASQ
jgi:hypothetical protein